MGEKYNPVKARAEASAMLGQLRRVIGLAPYGIELKIRSVPHDFGSYLEIRCYYDSDNIDQKSMVYIDKLEMEWPEHWDEQARAELQEAGVTVSASLIDWLKIGSMLVVNQMS